MKQKLRSLAFFPIQLAFILCVRLLTITLGIRPRNKEDSDSKRVLFLASFFPENAGYHWRVAKWAEELRKEGFLVDIKHVFARNGFEELRKNGSVLRFQIKSLWTRLKHIMASRKYDLVIARRTLLLYNEYGNLFYEKLLLKFHPNAVLDFDDDLLIGEDKITSKAYDPYYIKNRYEIYDDIASQLPRSLIELFRSNITALTWNLIEKELSRTDINEVINYAIQRNLINPADQWTIKAYLKVWYLSREVPGLRGLIYRLRPFFKERREFFRKLELSSKKKSELLQNLRTYPTFYQEFVSYN